MSWKYSTYQGCLKSLDQYDSLGGTFFKNWKLNNIKKLNQISIFSKFRLIAPTSTLPPPSSDLLPDALTDRIELWTEGVMADFASALSLDFRGLTLPRVSPGIGNFKSANWKLTYS